MRWQDNFRRQLNIRLQLNLFLFRSPALLHQLVADVTLQSAPRFAGMVFDEVQLVKLHFLRVIASEALAQARC